MNAPPTFASISEYASCRGDVDFWGPYIADVLKRHDLQDAESELVAGFNATYPTFLCGDVVVKLFGYTKAWRKSYAAERAALALVTLDQEIAAPHLLAEGHLYDDADASWPYLVSRRMSGISLKDAQLSTDQWHSLTVDMGKQVRRIHALPPSGIATHTEWQYPNLTEAAERSSLPPHLVTQVDDYVARLKSLDLVFTHGDLNEVHAFVENGRLNGIIDWADAIVFDRHYELIQLYRGTFSCDKTLFRIFLEAYDWPVDDDFPHKTLSFAIYRQAIGLAQHNSMDVFEPIAAQFPLRDIATLDELANELFAV